MTQTDSPDGWIGDPVEKGLTVILLCAGLCGQRMNWNGLSGILLKRYRRVRAFAPP